MAKQDLEGFRREQQPRKGCWQRCQRLGYSVLYNCWRALIGSIRPSGCYLCVRNAMRTAFLLFCVAGVPASVAVVRAVAEGEDNDLKQLQGKWVVVSAQFAGETDELAVGVRVEIAGKKITFKTGKTNWTEEFRVDPSKKPKAIDLLDSAKDKAKVAIYKVGIYQIEGEILKLCWDQTRRDVRPTE